MLPSDYINIKEMANLKTNDMQSSGWFKSLQRIAKMPLSYIKKLTVDCNG